MYSAAEGELPVSGIPHNPALQSLKRLGSSSTLSAASRSERDNYRITRSSGAVRRFRLEHAAVEPSLDRALPRLPREGRRERAGDRLPLWHVVDGHLGARPAAGLPEG